MSTPSRIRPVPPLIEPPQVSFSSIQSTLERVVSFLLYHLQFLFLSTYVRWVFLRFFGLKSFVTVYVFIKLSFSVVVFYEGWYQYTVVYGLIIYFMAETILYTLLKILCQELFARPNSYQRILILGVVNYIEIVFGFASLYIHGNFIMRASDLTNSYPVFAKIDYIYFSIGTGGVLGFGDYLVVAENAKVLAIIQCLIFLMFFILFVTYNLTMFTNRTFSISPPAGQAGGATNTT